MLYPTQTQTQSMFPPQWQQPPYANPYNPAPTVGFQSNTGKPVLLVDLFAPANRQQQAFGQPTMGQAPDTSSEGGSTLKKLGIGAVILAAAGALSYSQGWFPFNGKSEESNGNDKTGGTGEEEQDDHSDLGEHYDEDHSDLESLGSKKSGKGNGTDPSGTAKKKQKALGNWDKLAQGVKKKDKQERFQEAQREHEEFLRAQEEDNRKLKNGLTVKEDRELGLQLQPAYQEVLDTLDQHLHILEGYQNQLRQIKKQPIESQEAAFRKQDAELEEALQRLEKRKAEALEHLEQAKQYKKQSWHTDSKEEQIVQQQKRIEEAMADAKQIKINGLTVADTQRLSRQLTDAYQAVSTALGLPEDDKVGKEAQVLKSFQDLKANKTFTDSLGTKSSWYRQKTEEETIAPLLVTYKEKHAEAYQQLEQEGLLTDKLKPQSV